MGDKLPVTCCSSCRDTLETFANFVSMANATEKRLLELREIPKQIQKLPDVTAKVVHQKHEKRKGSDDLNTKQEMGVVKRDVKTIVKKLSGRSDLTMVKIGPPSSSAFGTVEKKVPIITNAPSSFLCMGCRERFDSFDALSNHMKTPGQCKKINIYKCNTCNKIFDKRKKFYQHSLSHRDRSSFVCDQCGKTYNNRFNLENHKSSIHGDAVEENDSAIYRCRLCSQQFTNRNELFRHIEAHGNPSRQAHLCDRCGKCFASQEALKSHSAIHTNGYVCTKCGQDFIRKGSLVQHECSKSTQKNIAAS